MDYKNQAPKTTKAEPNSAKYPVRMPENVREMQRTNVPVKSQLPKDSMSRPGRNEYAIPEASRVRDMNEAESRRGKPAQEKFLTDMEA